MKKAVMVHGARQASDPGTSVSSLLHVALITRHVHCTCTRKNVCVLIAVGYASCTHMTEAYIYMYMYNFTSYIQNVHYMKCTLHMNAIVRTIVITTNVHYNTLVVAMELTKEACWKPWLLAVTATSQRGLTAS